MLGRRTNPTAIWGISFGAGRNVAVVIWQAAAFKDVAHPAKLQSITRLSDSNDGGADRIVIGHDVNIQSLLVVALVDLKSALVPRSNVAPSTETKKVVASVVAPTIVSKISVETG